ncbi:MAG: glycosyltransferase family 4 protein [Anaerolineae bacterium]|nr:glycosyltransferase family 4 protein [Anaerolineae bacterium]
MSTQIAFLIDNDGTRWTGGVQYLTNLFYAIRQADPQKDYKICAVLAPSVQLKEASTLSVHLDEVIPFPNNNLWLRLWHQKQIRVLKNRLGIRYQPEAALSSLLRRKHIKALFSAVALEMRYRLPVIGWIPDFQQSHLPEMFSPAEVLSRNEDNRKLSAAAQIILLSSQSAKTDFEKLFPEYASKARVLPFATPVPEEIFSEDCERVCKLYHLPRRFFYLPNQFWKHKNHQIVLEALTIAHQSQPEITVVCTGNLNDGRNPLYSSELLAQVSERGLRDRFIVLGMVPRSHLYQLMRQSLAVLQPSLFEGWSTTVEEVKSIGKRIILSDIPVHREQNPPQAIYFSPHDPVSLAKIMVEVFQSAQPGPDTVLEAQARACVTARVAVFGKGFLQIVDEVCVAKP